MGGQGPGLDEGFDAGEGPGQLTGLKIEDGDIDSIDIVTGAGTRVARYDLEPTLVHQLSAVEEMHVDRDEPAISFDDLMAPPAPSPPSWDPLGLSPHLWGLVPDLPADPQPDIIGPAEFIARGFRALWTPFFLTLLCTSIVFSVMIVNLVMSGATAMTAVLMALSSCSLALLRCVDKDE